MVLQASFCGIVFFFLLPIYKNLLMQKNATLLSDIHYQSAYNFSNLCVCQCLSKGHLSGKCALVIHIYPPLKDKYTIFSESLNDSGPYQWLMEVSQVDRTIGRQWRGGGYIQRKTWTDMMESIWLSLWQRKIFIYHMNYTSSVLPPLHWEKS